MNDNLIKKKTDGESIFSPQCFLFSKKRKKTQKQPNVRSKGKSETKKIVWVKKNLVMEEGEKKC